MNVMLRRLWHSPTVTTWGSLAVRLSAVALVLPLVLIRFTPAEVALWQLFSVIPLLALMLDFGLAPTFARMFAFARGGANLIEMQEMRRRTGTISKHPDPGVAASVMSTLRWLYPRIALGATLLMAVVGTLGLIKPVAQSHSANSAWAAWGLVLASTGITLWGGAYSAALQGMDKIAVMRRWEAATGIGQVATSVFVLVLGGQLLALVAGYQLWAVVGALRSRWLLRSQHPELFNMPPAAHPAVLAVIWGPAWRSGLGVLMSHGLIQASGLIYSQIAPAAEVAAYLIALRVAMLISQFCQAPFYSKLPRMAELQAAGLQTAQLQLAQRGMRLAYWVFVAGSLLVAVAGQPALQALGSRTAFVSPQVWSLLALAFFAERFGAMHLQLYSLTNHIVWHIANSISGLLMVLIAITAFRNMGSMAFPIAMLASYVGFYCVYAALHTRAAFKINLLRFELGTAIPAALTLCAGLVLALLFPFHL